MTIFQHTWQKVIAKEKVQTARIWKPDYMAGVQYFRDGVDRFDSIISKKAWDAGKVRTLYAVDQILSVQPARGQNGVAKIRILELAKRDVRDFAEDDIRREGFETALEFYKVWYGMHFPAFVKLLVDGFVTEEWWLSSLSAQIPTHNTALVIRFELVESVAA